MASLIEIQKDVQDTVRLARFSKDTLKDLKLDTITYTVRDKAGKQVATYKGRENHEAAQEEAGNFDFTNPENGPHYVEAVSNLDVPESNDFLDFVTKAKNEIEFPIEEIRNKIKTMENAIDCETITQIIEDEIKGVIALLKEEMSDADILGGKVDLTKVPSDPMKIVSWAKKFVSKYLAPNLLATVELALLIAEMVSLVQDVIQAASAATQNVLLCAESVVDDVIDTVLDELSTTISETVPALDSALSAIGSIQGELSNITGKPPVFDVSSVDGLIQSATVENRAKLQADINEYVTAPFEESQLTANTMNSISGSIGPGLAANSALAVTTLASANAHVTRTDFVVGSQTLTFENGILINVV